MEPVLVDLNHVRTLNPDNRIQILNQLSLFIKIEFQSIYVLPAGQERIISDIVTYAVVIDPACIDTARNICVACHAVVIIKSKFVLTAGVPSLSL